MSVYKKLNNYYDQIFPLKKERVEFVLSYLKNKYLNILDIGCATGELAIALSKVGYSVTAIDLDEDMVKAALIKSAIQGSEVNFLAKDMLKVAEDFSQNSFDAVLCFGNTLPHLKNLKEITDFFLNLAAILIKGGMFFLQVVNFEKVLRENVKALPKLENKTFTFERKYYYNRKQHLIEFNTSLLLKISGEFINGHQLLFPLTAEEIKRILTHTGFSNFHFLENEAGLPFTERSPGLIVIAYKD